ncbi:hypothetical protein GCM10011371_12620 [Novosphingobium marinum]|uniref:Endolytic peptidoglycan transglycosylase RlpA n=1 Tax=Novosphingobium marinum TaxID=1514948 RepID=A0A7Y9XXW1_9SPHN|nr:septal ring lytic transglycosylase RlpA family protein [Novosphingobium marinum]NYH95370.1 rare lipoprotein A [Novosphingobium marinum]GGC26515.1 hypothetical protein GCM10011371_12620 [Novosphingobium marinum]
MNEQTHLPSRRKRLKAFVNLKRQRQYLVGAVALLLPASAALAVGYADESSSPERVPLGTGVASVQGVETEAPADAPALAEARNDADEAEPSPGVVSEMEIAGGNASYYGRRFSGKRTASGETFRHTGLTAAHRTLPFGSQVRVTNRRNGKSVVVRINDRGPFHRARVIDLSEAAAKQIGLLKRGHGAVRLSLLTS